MSGLGENGYLQQISQINNNVASFRGLQQEAREKQQELNISAKSENDLDDIRKIGAGFSEKAFKELLGKYGKNLYTMNLGKGRSVEALDNYFGKALGLTEQNEADSFGKLIGKLGDRVGSVGKGALDKLRSIGSGSIDEASSFANRLQINGNLDEVELFGGHSGDGGEVVGNIKDGLKNISEAGDETYGSFLEQVSAPTQVPRQITPIEELQKEPIETDQSVSVSDVLGKQTTSKMEYDPEDLEKFKDDSVSPEEYGEYLKNKYGFGSGSNIEEASSSIIEDVGETALTSGAREATTSAVSTGLEAVGAGLEASGVLAPLGLLFQAIGFAGDVYAGVEAGKGVVDAFENDVLGHQTYTAPKVAQPQKPNTLLSRNLLITPTSDTLHQQGTSYATGW